MAEHALFPGYVKFDYHSLWGKHVMILPTRAWNSVPLTGTLGSWTAWNGSNVDGEAMIDSFVNAIKAAFLASTSFDIATIYTIAALGDPAIPQAAKALGIVGTNTTGTQAKAAQSTWTMRDTTYNLSRLVFLDAPVGAGFEPTSDISGSPSTLAMFTQWSADTNAWSSRAGNRVSTFIKISYDLSDKLRREYGMV